MASWHVAPGLVMCGVLSSCGGSGSGDVDDDDDVPVQPMGSVESSAPADPGSGTERYEGTWQTRCLPNAGNLFASLGAFRHATFTFDGARASFITDYFDDSLCEQATDGSTGLIGTIAFGGTIVEDIFGVEATVITFASDVSQFNGTDLSEASVPAPFADLIYRSDGSLLFGAGSVEDAASPTPTALNVSLPYAYVGPANPLRLN